MKILKKYHVLLLLIAIVYMAIVLTYTLFPQSSLNQFLSTQLGLAQFYAFSIFFGVVMGIFSLLMMGMTSYKKGYRRPPFFIWAVMMVLSGILVIGGTGGHLSHDQSVDSNQPSFKIVEYNSANQLNSTNIQTIFGEYNTDIAVLPEFDERPSEVGSNERIKQLFKAANVNYDHYDVFISDHPTGVVGVTTIVKKSFAQFTQQREVPQPTFKSVNLKSQTANVPSIIGLHAAPPIPGYLMNYWQKDLHVISNQLANQNPDSILIGDFNANMNHGLLTTIATHEDGVNALPAFERGTWPASKLPAYFRTPIDHVLIPKNQYSVKNIKLQDLKTSDHMAIFMEVQKNKA
ncbi:endonuclease/exonuclease/phosphatase family protein [Holzapfeliella sp. JNUCC 80]